MASATRNESLRVGNVRGDASPRGVQTSAAKLSSIGRPNCRRTTLSMPSTPPPWVSQPAVSQLANAWADDAQLLEQLLGCQSSRPGIR